MQMTEQQTTDSKEKTTSNIDGYLAIAVGIAVLIGGWAYSTGQLPPIWPYHSEVDESVRQKFDLASQRWMAVSSVAMSVISAGTLFLLWRTLIATAAIAEETRTTTTAATDSAKSARDAIEASTQLGRTQAQAYLDIAACRIVFDFKSGQIVCSEVEIDIRNLGQTPTKLCSLAGTLQFTPASRTGSVATFQHPMGQQVISNREGMTTTEALWKFSEFDFPSAGKIAIVGNVFYRTAFDENYTTPFRFELELSDVLKTAIYMNNSGQKPSVYPMEQIHTLDLVIHQRVDPIP